MVFSEYNGDCVSRVKMEDGTKEFVFYNREDDLGIYEIRDIAEERTGKQPVKVEQSFTWDKARDCYV